MIFSENRFPLFGIMLYAMPRADDFCAFQLAENEVPTATNR